MAKLRYGQIAFQEDKTEIKTALDIGSVNDASFSNKAEKGTYTGTVGDLKDELDAKQFQGLTTYQTLAEMQAVTPVPAEGTPAKVANDSTESNNGYYSVVSGSWVKDSDLVENTVDKNNTTKGVTGRGVFDFSVEEAMRSNWMKKVAGTLTNLEARALRVVKEIKIDNSSISNNLGNGEWFLAHLTRNDPTYGDRVIIRCKGVSNTISSFVDQNPSGTYSDFQEIEIKASNVTIKVTLDFSDFEGSETVMISTSNTPKIIIKNFRPLERFDSEVNKYTLINSGSGYVRIVGDLLQWRGVIFFRGSNKYVYLNDLTNTAQTASSAINEIDLSTVANLSYFYIDLDEFDAAYSGANINVRKSSGTWITYIPKNHFIIGIIQMSGVESSYSGKLFELYINNKVSLIGTEGEVFEYNLNAMSNYRNKIASINNGNNESLVIGLHGDSWTHKKTLFSRYTTFVSRSLRNKYGNGGGGFYDFSSSSGGYNMESIDEDDANDTRGGTINYIDQTSGALGVNCAHPEFEAGSSLTLNVTSAHEKFVIHYYGSALNGVFRYRIDGGSWVNVDTSLTSGYQTIDEVVSDATHTIDFECISGTCVILGVDMQRNSGVRVHKLGNRGLKAIDVSNVDSTNWKNSISALGMDCFSTLLGTNDRTLSVSLSDFKTRMKVIFDLVNEAEPYIDFCFISPSNNQNVESFEMSEYSKQLYELSKENECAFLSLIPLFGSREKLTSKGFFIDTVHPTIEGGKAISELIIQKLFI